VSVQNMAMGSLRFAYVIRETQFRVAQTLICVTRKEAGRKGGISKKRRTQNVPNMNVENDGTSGELLIQYARNITRKMNRSSKLRS
jgi:hypothetical protein